MMQAGFAKQSITPKIGLLMAGYEGLRKSTGVLDELHVRCIYLKQEEEVFLFQYDLLYVDATFCEQLSEHICKKYGIKKEHVLINAIHTHSGPAQILDKTGINRRLDYIDGEYDEELVRFLLAQGILAAQQAYDNCEEASLSFAQDHYQDIGTNRNQPDRLIDDMLSVLHIQTSSQRTALIFSYACHPTIFHEENSCYSCDLLGPAFEALEKEHEVAMFYNGACGDVSTRFTKKGSGRKEAKRLGLLLVDHVRETLGNLVPMQGELQISCFTFTCQTRTYPTVEKLQAYGKQLDTKTKEYELYLLYEKMSCFLRNQRLSLPIHILHIHRLAYVYVPVELFSALALYLKQQVKDQSVVLVGYAMDYYSYMPDRSAYHERPIGFEAVITPFEEGCGERLMDEIAMILHKE